MRYLAPIVAAAAVALLAAGCGGGGKSPGVANLADSTTTGVTTTTQSDSGSGAKPFGPSGASGRGQFKLSMRVNAADGEKFSACMRKHGLPNYPDPNSQGVITIDSGMGIDPGSPAFRSAQATCSKLLPNGGQPTPAQIAQRQQQAARVLGLHARARDQGLPRSVKRRPSDSGASRKRSRPEQPDPPEGAARLPEVLAVQGWVSP